MADGMVSEKLARPVRTAVQAAPSWVITEFIDAWVYNMNDKQYGALVALLTMAFAYAQTAIEDASGKGFLRAVPPKEVPVVDDTPNPPVPPLD